MSVLYCTSLEPSLLLPYLTGFCLSPSFPRRYSSSLASTFSLNHLKIHNMSSRRVTLFVAGFGHDLRARDLAYEFERYGRLVRCDIPAPKSQTAKVGYAFVEFEDERDAEEAYHDMHGRRVDGYQLTVQWAKNAPSTNWRYERGDNRGDSRGGGGGRDYGRDSRGGGGGRDDRGSGGGRGRSRSPPRRSGGGDDGGRRRSPSPLPPRRSSPLPSRGGDADRDDDMPPASATGNGSGNGAEKDDAPVEGGRYRDEPSPVAANGVRRDERSLSPRA